MQYCLSDGTILTLQFDDASTAETVFMKNPVYPTNPSFTPPSTTAASATAAAQSSIPGWLYAILGGLVVLVGVMAWMLFASGAADEKKTNDVVKWEVQETKSNAEQTPKTSEANIVTTIARREAEKTPKTEPPQTPVSTVNPSGRWAGDWNSKSTYFTAEAFFNEDGSGKVSGQITWTLRRTSNPKKADKVGSSATEYVQGTFNPVTRVLSLKGLRKDDPNNIVILDRYNLVVAADNQTITGRSIGGNFVLRR